MNTTSSYSFSQLLTENRTAIMGFSIICIMLYHQNWLVNGLFNQYMRMLGYLGVEVFLLVSGFGIAHSLRKNPVRTFYRNRFVRLMPACIVYGVLKLICCHLPYIPASNDFFLLDLFSISHWYIYAIIIYYALSPLLYWAVNRFGWKFLVLVSIASILLIILWPYNADATYFVKYGRWIVKRLPVFIFGISIAQKPMNLRPIEYCSIGIIFMVLNLFFLKKIIFANAAPDICSIPVKLFMYMPDRTVIPDNGRYLLDMMSVLFICPIFAGAGWFCRKINVEFIITWLGASSLELYLCHQFIYKAVDMKFDSDPIGKIVLGLVIVFVVTVLIKQLSLRLIILCKKLK